MNIRILWDAGLTIAFGTDPYRGQNETLSPATHEIESLGKILSPTEVIAALTTNGATFLGLSDDLGSLEPGKLADIVIVRGDPLSELTDLTNVEVVIQGGRVVLDNR